MSAGLARPVRMLARSTEKCSTDLLIFDSASRRIGSIIAASPPPSPPGADQSTDLLAQDDSFDVAWDQEIEDHDRNVVVHAQRHCRVVHHLDPAVEHLEVVQ